MTPLLELNDLRVTFRRGDKLNQVVRGVSFQIQKGEAVALVGESGSGKSMTAQSILKLIRDQGVEISGSICFKGEELMDKSDRQMQQIRGRNISMIFQDPMTSLNPLMKIGNQIIEGLQRHHSLSRKEARQQAIEMLRLVGIPLPEMRIDQYPFEFSGGMRQRVMIAIAVACGPELLIADEPTTALDVTIQAQILNLLKEIRQKNNTSILLITHDLGIVAGLCDRVMVLYAGKIVETGTVQQLFRHPQHPYTQALLKAIPKLGGDKSIPLTPIMGAPPDLSRPLSGCSFHPRCQYAMQVCQSHCPPLFSLPDGQQAACWLHHPFAKGETA
jgi:oligopeptide transport system ATP-binding protein